MTEAEEEREKRRAWKERVETVEQREEGKKIEEEEC